MFISIPSAYKNDRFIIHNSGTHNVCRGPSKNFRRP